MANRSAPSEAPTNCSAADAASPASFHPLKAQMSAGARRPSGRRSQISGCIRFTVHDGCVPIATLRPGEEIAGVFACTRKDRLLAKSGTPYLALELRDQTGAIQARAFRDPDVLAGRFERGDLVRIAGRVERFRDALQVEVRAIAKAAPGEAAPAEFLPTAYRNVEELDGFLEHLVTEVRDPGFDALLDSLLADGDLRAEWRRAPCTRNGHHAYLGGLLEHTVAVGTLALETCVLHPKLNQALLLTAAIVHDLGRTREFTYGAEIGITEEGRLLGHIELGLRMLDERGRKAGLDESRQLALAHCVLTHHGARRFESPEALALYRLNALDSAVKGALEHGLHSQSGM